MPFDTSKGPSQTPLDLRARCVSLMAYHDLVHSTGLEQGMRGDIITRERGSSNGDTSGRPLVLHDGVSAAARSPCPVTGVRFTSGEKGRH
jgi:hypothetical protein